MMICCNHKKGGKTFTKKIQKKFKKNTNSTSKKTKHANDGDQGAIQRGLLRVFTVGVVTIYKIGGDQGAK
jgi:hypothetical protein